MYNFTRLIQKYGQSLTIVEFLEGYYDMENGGEWVPGAETTTDFTGVVTRFDSDDTIFEENGVYAASDRKLRCYENIEENATVRFGSDDYTVAGKMDYSNFDSSERDGLFVYRLVRKE